MTESDLEATLRLADEAMVQIEIDTQDTNEVIAEFERALNSRQFGASGYVLLERDEIGPDVWERHLCYRKRGKRWGLFIEDSLDTSDPEHCAVRELASAGRDIRYAAIEHFPDLVRDIVERLRAHAQGRQAAIAQARKLTAMLNSVDRLLTGQPAAGPDPDFGFFSPEAASAGAPGVELATPAAPAQRPMRRRSTVVASATATGDKK